MEDMVVDPFTTQIQATVHSDNIFLNFDFLWSPLGT